MKRMLNNNSLMKENDNRVHMLSYNN